MASSVIEPAHSGDEIDSKLNRIQNGADRLNFWAGVLGLSIARRAIELHKGAIRAKNADPGLEIELELPVTQP
jgi:signal transduction histidine kinase